MQIFLLPWTNIMLLNEFFGRMNLRTSSSSKEQEEIKIKEEGMSEDIFECIINDDDLHKKVFFPIAEEIVNKPTEEHDPSIWMPLVNKGCMKFYRQHELKEDPKKLFSKKFREDLCTKMSEHYNKDILKGAYNLGN